MRPSLVLYPLIILVLVSGCQGQDEDKEALVSEEMVGEENREKLVDPGPRSYTYEQAVQAYLEEDWDACVQAFRYLLNKYTKYKSAVITCRRRCRAESEKFEPIFRENIEDLHFYEKKVKETLCIIKCNQEYRESVGRYALKRMPLKEEWKFITAEPYEYLHNCYFKKEYYQKAADAVFTFLVYNPNHGPSKLSLTHYMSLPEVDNATIRNLMAEPFIEEYVKGIKAYELEFFEEAVMNLENSISIFLKSEEDCRFYCEGPFYQEWNPDFITSISNHFVFVANCKRRCARTLSTVNGKYESGFLENHFNYLQFAYYKLGNIKKACEAVESYLLFYPADETMLVNKQYYQTLPRVEDNYFTPREEMTAYLKRQEYEKRLLVYVNDEFNAFDKYIEEYEAFLKKESIQIEPQEIFFMNRTYKTSFEKDTSEMQNYTTTNKVYKSKFRFLKEGLINQSECQSIMQLAESTTWEGDGYENNISPHSEHESFEGVTIGRLAVLTYFGLLESKLLKLLLHVIEEAKGETESIINIREPLYISYTHLVCRTALPGSPSNRSDYSHRIHADNCLAENDGSCRSESPAYVWRDYSSILYMNDDFQGGNFIFVKDKIASTVEATVRPKCGRMLTFSSGGENLHGVTALTRGRRCALGLWFTLQKSHDDLDMALAKKVLKVIEQGGAAATDNQEISLDDVQTYERHRSILIQKFL